MHYYYLKDINGGYTYIIFDIPNIMVIQLENIASLNQCRHSSISYLVLVVFHGLSSLEYTVNIAFGPVIHTIDEACMYN